MVNIKLHGIFEEFVPTDWQLNVQSIAEVFEAIESNTGKLINTLGILEEYISYFIIYLDDKIVPPEYFHSPIVKKDSKIQVVPLIMGSDPSGGILTALLMMAIGTGIQFLVTKLLTPKSPVDIKTTSMFFNNYENVAKRNVVVPIGYGRLKLGTVVVSNDLNVSLIASSDQTL